MLRAPRPAAHQRGREHDGADRPPAPLAAGEHAVDQHPERPLELRARGRLRQLQHLLQTLGRHPRAQRRVPPAGEVARQRPGRAEAIGQRARAGASRAHRAWRSRSAPAPRAAPRPPAREPSSDDRQRREVGGERAGESGAISGRRARADARRRARRSARRGPPSAPGCSAGTRAATAASPGRTPPSPRRPRPTRRPPDHSRRLRAAWRRRQRAAGDR